MSHIFIILPSVDGQLDQFHFLRMANGAIINTGADISVVGYGVLWDICPGGE